jgi:hypothetical protein
MKSQKRMRSNVQGAFDRIRAKCVCEVGSALKRIEYIRTHACRNVCVR